MDITIQRVKIHPEVIKVQNKLKSFFFKEYYKYHPAGKNHPEVIKSIEQTKVYL